MKLFHPIAALFCLIVSTVSGQDHFDAPRSTQFHLFTNDEGHEHQVLVVLPGSYESSLTKRYPVLYMTDAQWDLTLVNSILGKLSYDKSLVEVIMVGLSYPGKDADYEFLRMRDLSPSRVETLAPQSGGAKAFLEFVENDIIPEIESSYRIDTEKRALGGVSMGGLFSLYAMYEKPQLFQRFISISPATVWDEGFIFRRDEEHAESGAGLPVRLFLSYGGGEYAAYSKPIAHFQEVLADRAYEGMDLLNWTMEGERHGGVAAEGWTRGLRWAFRDVTPYRPGPMEELFTNMRRAEPTADTE